MNQKTCFSKSAVDWKVVLWYTTQAEQQVESPQGGRLVWLHSSACYQWIPLFWVVILNADCRGGSKHLWGPLLARNVGHVGPTFPILISKLKLCKFIFRNIAQQHFITVSMWCCSDKHCCPSARRFLINNTLLTVGFPCLTESFPQKAHAVRLTSCCLHI